MIQASELKELGLEKQSKLLFEMLHILHDRKTYKLAAEMSSLPGMKVNDSFFDVMKKNSFSNEEIQEAFLHLGVNFENVPGKKPYQFWKNDWRIKFINALKLLP